MVDSPCLFDPPAFLTHDENYSGRALPIGAVAPALPNFGRPLLADEANAPEDQLKLVEKYLILDALMRSSWSQEAAARRLGISPRRLNYKIMVLGIRHERWKANVMPADEMVE